MNTSKKVPYFKIAGGIVLISTLVYAAMTFAPSTQPVTTMAPYAFDAGNLLRGDTRAFRPWFENGAWQGDVIEYDVDEFGVRSTDADVGSNPPTATGNNWMARATFADKEANVRDYWQESSGNDSRRSIFTVNSDSGSQVPFLWNNLSDAQKSALDPATAIIATADRPYDSDILNFVRGDHSNEKSATGGTLRLRYSLLGDIINSNPVYIGQPEEAFVIEGFPTFKFDNADRAGRVAVGANDGMLHVFDASDGSEVYAYIPSMLIGNLGNLAKSPYNHTYYVDGELFYGSAFITDTWKSLLSGGLGAGGKGLFILDVTNPDPSDDKVLYEITGTNIGHIYGKPRFGRTADGSWNVYIGNGYGNTNASGNPGNAELLIISLEDGSISRIDTGLKGGLSAPALVSGADRVVDFVFAGDTNGNMYRFDLTDNSVETIFDSIADAGIPYGDRPIMTAPVIGAHPNGGFMAFFGTGNKTSLVDVADASYPIQAIYGIWDSANDDVIVQQHLAETTATFSTQGDGTGSPTSNTEDVRYIVESAGPGAAPGNAAVDYGSSVCKTADNCAKGWMVELPNVGERVLGTPSLRAGRVSVVTTNPVGTDGEPDLEGDSWLMSLFYLTGGDGDDISFNLSGDGILNDDDRFTLLNSDALLPPVGIGLGDGMISQPTIVRVADGIDMVFINGLRLPLPQTFEGGPFLSGHIDVETDSPSTAPSLGGSVAPNEVKKHSEGYDVRSSDGLGRAVDGHVHAYDTIHNVNWVDFFELEPRRGLGNMGALPVPPDGGSCPDGSTGVYNNDVEPPSLQGCVEIVEAELNRAFDTYGSPDEGPTLEAEVHGRDTDKPLSKSQKFIVILANADLSAAGKIQIGCRVWDVVDYQDMITAQLEAIPAASPGDLKDTETGIPLVVSLESIAGGKVYYDVDSTGSDGGDCADLDEDLGLSKKPTLRIAFTQRSILDGGIHGTRSQCVLGLHDYRDKVCYSDAAVLGNAKAAIDAGVDPDFSFSSCQDDRFIGTKPGGTPPPGYIRDPARNLHITESLEGDNGKWRWRNGALTLQLLKVSDSNQAQYNLQGREWLPQRSRGQRVYRFGGTYAQAFTDITQETDPLTGEPIGKPYPAAGGAPDTGESIIWPESGLLYEATLYWHYSDLAENLRRAEPSSLPCYGDSSYNSALTQELGGLTLGEYQKLIEGLGDVDEQGSLIAQYSALLDELASAIAAGDQNQVNQILLELGELLQGSTDLQDYIQYRDYAPGHIPEQKLLEFDKDLVEPPGGDGGSSSTDDGTPVNVDDLEGFGMGGGGASGGGLTGNDVLEGLRIWIDPRD